MCAPKVKITYNKHDKIFIYDFDDLIKCTPVMEHLMERYKDKPVFYPWIAGCRSIRGSQAAMSFLAPLCQSAFESQPSANIAIPSNCPGAE
jgi:hypothetical protein